MWLSFRRIAHAEIPITQRRVQTPSGAGVLSGETLHGLAKRHDLSRNLIRIWVGKYEADALDEDAGAADLVQEYEAQIAALVSRKF